MTTTATRRTPIPSELRPQQILPALIADAIWLPPPTAAYHTMCGEAEQSLRAVQLAYWRAIANRLAFEWRRKEEAA